MSYEVKHYSNIFIHSFLSIIIIINNEKSERRLPKKTQESPLKAETEANRRAPRASAFEPREPPVDLFKHCFHRA